MNMTTRREILFATLCALTAARAPGLPAAAGPLQVTFYYLPG
jgi:hypothetical protein